MRKKGIPVVLDRSVMSRYEGAKSRVKMGMHQVTVLSPFPITVVVVVVIVLAKAC